MAPLRHARSLIGLKRFAEAEKLVLELDTGADAKADPALRKSTHATLVELYQASEQPEKAADYE